MGNERAAWEVLRARSPLPKSRGGYLGAWRLGGGGEPFLQGGDVGGKQKQLAHAYAHAHRNQLRGGK